MVILLRFHISNVDVVARTQRSSEKWRKVEEIVVIMIGGWRGEMVCVRVRVACVCEGLRGHIKTIGSFPFCP